VSTVVVPSPQQAWASTWPLGDLAVRGAALWPDREAVVIDDDRATFAELDQRAELFARALRSYGVEPGDIVALFMTNSLDYLVLVLAIARIGGVSLLLNARYRGEELGDVLADAMPVMLITSPTDPELPDFRERLEQGLPSLATSRDPAALDLPELPTLDVIIAMGQSQTFVDLDTFLAAARQTRSDEVEALRRRVAIRDVAMMMYTSGTTARPKGCVMTHEMVVRNCSAAGRHRFLLTPEDRLWDPLPMFHMSAILPWIACMDAGARYVGMGHFDAGRGLAQLEREAITYGFFAFHAIVQPLVDHPDFATADLSNLRAFNSIGDADTLRRAQSWFPQAIQISAYGSTETGGVTCFNELTDTAEQRATTSGRPFPGIRIRAVDVATGAPCAPGDVGELRVTGYSLLERYHNDPERTAAGFDDQGWFCTGDLGWVGADGRVTYVGRLKDMLKVGGENVAAAEVEGHVMRHDAVAMCAVVGIPDPLLDEVPVAFVEVRPGRTLSGQQVIDHCTGHMASFKVPRAVHIVEEWPMSATKIQKFRLRAMALDAELASATESA